MRKLKRITQSNGWDSKASNLHKRSPAESIRDAFRRLQRHRDQKILERRVKICLKVEDHQGLLVDLKLSLIMLWRFTKADSCRNFSTKFFLKTLTKQGSQNLWRQTILGCQSAQMHQLSINCFKGDQTLCSLSHSMEIDWA